MQDSRIIALYDAMKSVDEWLNSESVFVLDKDGNRIEGGKVDCVKGSLLEKFMEVVQQIHPVNNDVMIQIVNKWHAQTKVSFPSRPSFIAGYHMCELMNGIREKL